MTTTFLALVSERRAKVGVLHPPPELARAIIMNIVYCHKHVDKNFKDSVSEQLHDYDLATL